MTISIEAKDQKSNATKALLRTKEWVSQKVSRIAVITLVWFGGATYVGGVMHTAHKYANSYPIRDVVYNVNTHYPISDWCSEKIGDLTEKKNDVNRLSFTASNTQFFDILRWQNPAKDKKLKGFNSKLNNAVNGFGEIAVETTEACKRDNVTPIVSTY